MVSDQSAKDEVKRAADIVELIGQYVTLKKAGRNHMGLCPFHTEKAPSFTVSSEKQIFHCFGCKKGGDVFSFWMEYHNATFPEALKDLADRYQVRLPDRPRSTEERKQAALKQSIYAVNELAAEYFQKSLHHPRRGKPAQAYLKKRLLPKAVVSEFRLGYAPDEWEGLIGFLKKRGADMETAAKAGLAVPRKRSGHYDRFRGRFMFPICNMRGQIVGFGGRVLDDSLPKYINTPETAVFRKGELLYGMHAAFNSIREARRAVVVEGYTDFLALWGKGLHAVTATLGTALTEEHVRRLKGYSDTVVMVFDSDEAGRSAVLSTAPLFSNEGVSARAVVLPEGQDPDSFVNAHGLEEFQALIDRAPTLFDFYLEQRSVNKDDDVEKKVLILKELIPILSALNDTAQRALYARRLSEQLGIKEEVIWQELRTHRRKPGKSRPGGGLGDRLTGPKANRRFDELHLLNLLIHYPHTIARLISCEGQRLVSDPVISEIVNAIFERHARDGACSMDQLVEELPSEAACEQLREALMESCRFTDDEAELAVIEIEQKVHQKKISTYMQQARGDAEALNEALKLKRVKTQSHPE